jgi:hypothetical protein
MPQRPARAGPPSVASARTGGVEPSSARLTVGYRIRLVACAWDPSRFDEIVVSCHPWPSCRGLLPSPALPDLDRESASPARAVRMGSFSGSSPVRRAAAVYWRSARGCLPHLSPPGCTAAVFLPPDTLARSKLLGSDLDAPHVIERVRHGVRQARADQRIEVRYAQTSAARRERRRRRARRPAPRASSSSSRTSTRTGSWHLPCGRNQSAGPTHEYEMKMRAVQRPERC